MYTTSLRPLVGMAFMLVACDDPEPRAASCGPHGVVHGDHCDCDTGYREVDGLCVPRVADTSDTTDTTPDLDTTPDTDPADTTPDLDTTPDTTPDTPDVADVGPEPTALDLSSASSAAYAMTGDDGSKFWVFEVEALPYVLSLELYPTYGGPDAAGTVQITAAETDYGTCGTCLVLQTGCEAHGDHFHCDRVFMPEVGGAVVLTALGTRTGASFAGHLHDIVFREVEIAQDYTTTPVVGGARFAVEHWDFETTLVEQH